MLITFCGIARHRLCDGSWEETNVNVFPVSFQLKNGKKRVERMKYVVCFSGGHGSALAAVETVKKYGRKNTILLNHDISDKVEDMDVKRFKKEVSVYLGVPITYANRDNFQIDTPLSLCQQKKTIHFPAGNSICTYYLKTEPFYKWLKENYPVRNGIVSQEITLVYGFGMKEEVRIKRRKKHLLKLGYLSEYPLAEVNQMAVVQDIQEFGIALPETYDFTKHANCKGCLKAGKQHWYMVYCRWPEIFLEAMETEKFVGYSIMKGNFLHELIPLYEKMKDVGIEPNDIECSAAFWSQARKLTNR